MEKQMKERERLLKGKDYAKKQREIIQKNAKKTGSITVLESEPPGSNTNYHVQIHSG